MIISLKGVWRLRLLNKFKAIKKTKHKPQTQKKPQTPKAKNTHNGKLKIIKRTIFFKLLSVSLHYALKEWRTQKYKLKIKKHIDNLK